MSKSKLEIHKFKIGNVECEISNCKFQNVDSQIANWKTAIENSQIANCKCEECKLMVDKVKEATTTSNCALSENN